MCFKQQNKEHISEQKEHTLPVSEKCREYHLVLFFTDIKAKEKNNLHSDGLKSAPSGTGVQELIVLYKQQQNKTKQNRYPAEKELAFEQPDVT